MRTLLAKYSDLADKPLVLIAFLLFFVICVVFANFQEGFDLPKILVWFLGFGALLMYLGRKSSTFTSIAISKPAGILLLGLAGLTLINPLFSSDVINSVVGVYPRYIYSVIFFASWLLFLVFTQAFHRDKLGILFHSFIFGSLVVSILGIAQFFGFAHYEGIEAPVRAVVRSLLGNPNFAAMLVVVTMPLVVYYASISRIYYRVFYLAVLLISLVGLIIFNSRGAFLALIAVAIGSFLMLAGSRKYLYALMAIIMFSATFLTYWIFYQDSRVDIPGPEAQLSITTVETRLLVWDQSLTKIMEKPWFGHGFGNFFLAFRDNDQTAFADREWFDDAHNAMLGYTVMAGIPAALILLSIIFYAGWYAGRSFWIHQDIFAGALVIALVSWFIAGSFNPVVLVNWLFLGLLIGAMLTYTPQRIIRNVGHHMKKIVMLIGFIFVALGICGLMSETFLSIANQHLDRQEAASANYYARLAVTFNPFNTNARLSEINSLVHLENYEQAELKLDAYIAQHKHSSGLYVAAAQEYLNMYHKTNNEHYKQLVIELIYKGLPLHKNYAFAYATASQAMAHLNEPQLLRELSAQSVIMNPETYRSWLYYGYANYLLGNKAATIFALDKANIIQPHTTVLNARNEMSRADNVQDVNFPFN